MSRTYGIISDMHELPIASAIESITKLMDKGIDSLILNGDIMGERSGINPMDYLAAILDHLGKSSITAYALPGSHELVNSYEPVIRHYSRKHPNIIDTFNDPKITMPDHDLVFLQGSDFRPTGAREYGYSLQTGMLSGIYANGSGRIRVVNANDLKKHVTDPEKTIVFSHVPRKFDGVENCVDVAEFFEVTQNFNMGGQFFNQGGVLPASFGYGFFIKGYPVAYKKENRGNETLRQIFEEIGVKKNMTGHFHESAGRAHDLFGNAITEGVYSTELFYNASCADRGYAGILRVDGINVSYEKVDINS